MRPASGGHMGSGRNRYGRGMGRRCGSPIDGEEESVSPEQVFLDSLRWLEEHYGDFRFFAERDVVWTLQEHIRARLEAERMPYLVFNDFPILKGNRRSLC